MSTGMQPGDPIQTLDEYSINEQFAQLMERLNQLNPNKIMDEQVEGVVENWKRKMQANLNGKNPNLSMETKITYRSS